MGRVAGIDATIGRTEGDRMHRRDFRYGVGRREQPGPRNDKIWLTAWPFRRIYALRTPLMPRSHRRYPVKRFDGRAHDEAIAPGSIIPAAT